MVKTFYKHSMTFSDVVEFHIVSVEVINDD